MRAKKGRVRKRIALLLLLVAVVPPLYGAAQTARDRTRLPLGDGRLSQAPERGAVWACPGRFDGGGAFRDGPWIHDDGTWDATTKPAVGGDVAWPDAAFAVMRDRDTRRITGNGLPPHGTGVYSVARTDEAYQYDRNPNVIRPQSLNYALPATPTLAAHSSCLPLGPIGVLTTGVVLYNGLDAAGRDAVAHEMQDACGGHPERTGQYHYHDLSTCVDDDSGTNGSSRLVGYALDGFGIFGPRDENGRELTNADLDECHGRVSEILWDGERVAMYHYVATREYPYTLGCFRGTPMGTMRPPPPGPVRPPPPMR